MEQKLYLVPNPNEKPFTSDRNEHRKQALIRVAMRQAFAQILHEVSSEEKDPDLWEGLKIASLKSDYIDEHLVATLNHRYKGSLSSLYDRMHDIIHSDKKTSESNLSA